MIGDGSYFMAFEGTELGQAHSQRKPGWEEIEEWTDHPCFLAPLLLLFVNEDRSLEGLSSSLMRGIRHGLSSH